jgi:hypothetical protein
MKIYYDYFREEIDADRCRRKVHKISLRERKRIRKCSIRKTICHSERWSLEANIDNWQSNGDSATPELHS